MSTLVLFGLILLIGFLNLMTGLMHWLITPYGLTSTFLAANLLLCAFTSFCPPARIMRNLCARAGCGPD